MNVREAIMDSVGSRVPLLEKGTRYDHYMEMKEIFLLGLDVLDRMNPAFVSANDKAMKVKLANAVELITKRIDYLSDFASKTANYGDLARQVTLIGRHVTPLLTEGSNAAEKPESKVADKPGDSEDQELGTNLT
jgi:hypothetical protein